MTDHQHPAGHLQSDRVHPRVYQAIAALALCLILSVWVFFSFGSYNAVMFGVVTVFIVIAVGLPLILSRVGDGLEDAEHDHHRPAAFREWASSEFNAWSGPLGAKEAVVQVLLPIAAVSIGLTLIGLAFYLAEPAGVTG
jgi:hypothetical protein